MLTTQREKNTGVMMAALIKTIEVFSRLVLGLFGLIHLIGVLWFSNTLPAYEIFLGISFTVVAFIVGFSPLKTFHPTPLSILYLVLGLIGMTITAYFWRPS